MLHDAWHLIGCEQGKLIYLVLLVWPILSHNIGVHTRENAEICFNPVNR